MFLSSSSPFVKINCAQTSHYLQLMGPLLLFTCCVMYARLLLNDFLDFVRNEKITGLNPHLQVSPQTAKLSIYFVILAKTREALKHLTCLMYASVPHGSVRWFGWSRQIAFATIWFYFSAEPTARGLQKLNYFPGQLKNWRTKVVQDFSHVLVVN